METMSVLPLLLQQSSLGEAQCLAAGDDQMIEDSDIHQRQGFAKAPRDEFVSVAGFGDSAWVVVAEDDGRGVVPEGFLNDFARVHGGTVNCSPEEFLTGNQPMTGVEVDQREDFVLALRQAGHEVIGRGLR